MNSNITVSELLNLKNPDIIDIRNHHRYLMGHIPNAKNIFSAELFYHPEKYLKKEKTYYLYCDSGVKSMSLSQKLNSIGYSTVNLVGGYHNYLLRK